MQQAKKVLGFTNKLTHVFVIISVTDKEFFRYKLYLQAYVFIVTNDQPSVSRGSTMSYKQLKLLNESEWVFNHSQVMKIIQKAILLRRKFWIILVLAGRSTSKLERKWNLILQKVMFKHTQSCSLCSNTPSHAYISLKLIVMVQGSW